MTEEELYGAEEKCIEAIECAGSTNYDGVREAKRIVRKAFMELYQLSVEEVKNG